MSKPDEIPALSYILEPALVASLLTAGCLLNRRRPADIVQAHAVLRDDPPPAGDNGWNWHEMKFFMWTIKVPGNERFRMKLFSRFLGMFPFLMEVWYWLLTYWIYQIARAVQALTMGADFRSLAETHARQIITIERFFRIDIELGLQHFVMKREWLLIFFNKTYAMVHIPATIAFMAYSYRYFNPLIFQSTRRTLVLCNCLAFIVFSSWPCMPPRLLPYEEFGYVDTLHTGKAASIWTTNKFQNQLAAFPSLHFGYSFVIGLSLFIYSPHRLIRAISLFYPLLILLVIMATANHYILDAVGGFFVTIFAQRLNRLLLNLRPIEEWFFWVLRIERPMDKVQFQSVIESDKINSPTHREMSQPLMGNHV
ncbi:integral membrane protein [Kwoniella heveanensis CBS 569]|nr:integral membrane protein [Kwoniella heveanensis CBS 569]